MPFDLDNLSNLTVTENDAFCDYLSGLPELQSGREIVAESFGEISRDKFGYEDGVQVLDFDVNNRFKLVPDGAGGLQLVHQYREKKDSPFEEERALKPVGEGYYAFPDLNDYGAGDLFLSVLKMQG